MKKFTTPYIFFFISCYAHAQIPTQQEWKEIFYQQKSAWTQTFVDFDVNNIVFTYDQPFRISDYVKSVSEKDWYQYLTTYNDFLFYNKADSYFVDLLAYVYIQEKNNKYYAMADVDNAIIVGSIKDKNTIQLAFCGTPCKYEDVYWIDDHRVVILGNTEDFNNLEKRIPFLMMADVSTRSTYHFEMRHTFMKEDALFSQPKFKKLIWDFDYDEIFGNKSDIEAIELEELR